MPAPTRHRPPLDVFGFTTVALCFPDQGIVVVLANAQHDVDTLAGNLVQAAGT